MKPTILIVSFLATSAQAVSYWCANGPCNNGAKQGVGPTYWCGKYSGLEYYNTGSKRWTEVGVKPRYEVFWKPGMFKDCCNAKGKSGCYDV